MKIVLFLPDISRIGGVEHVVANRSALFAEMENSEVIILSCFNTNSTSPYTIHPKVKLLNLQVPIYPSNPIRKISWYLSLLKPLTTFLITEKPDIIFAEGSYLCSTLSLIKNKTLVKAGCEHIGFQSLNSIHKGLCRFLYPRLDLLVVLTQNDRIHYSKFLKNVIAIPNFINSSSELLPDLDSKIIVSAGRLEFQKGFDRLIKAFALIVQRYPDWSLVIHGEGIERTKLEDLCKKLQLETKVSFPGTSHNLLLEFSKASIFVMSSRFEGFPMVLIEAMSSRLPCISYNCSGPDEIIDNGINGILVNQNSIKQLAEKIVFLIENHDKRKELSNQAILKAELYSAPKLRTQWAEILANIDKSKVRN